MSTAPKKTEIADASTSATVAERRFWKDLPNLLSRIPGQWVVYTAQGLYAEGTDELHLFHRCKADGLKRHEFVIARVEADAPVAEATWLTEER